MNIPLYGPQQVAPTGLPDVRVQPTSTASGEAALAQGVEGLGRGADDLAQVYHQHQEKAAELQATNAETEFEKSATSALYGTEAEAQLGGAGGSAGAGAGGADQSLAPHEANPNLPQEGLLNARGLKAVEASGHTLDYLTTRRQEIADALPNDRARQLFLQSTNGRLEAYHRTIEQHTAQQNEAAAVVGLKARQEMAVNDIANNYADPVALTSNVAAVDQRIRALQLSPEAGDAQVQAWHQQAYSTVLQQHLADKDWKGAQDFYSTHKADLGAQGTQFAHAIDILKDQQQGDALASKIVTGAAISGGLHDTAKMDADFLALPVEQRTPQAVQSFHEQKAVAEEQDRGTAANVWKTARSQYLTGGMSAVNPVGLTWMRDNDPDAYASFMAQAQKDAARRAAPAAAADKPTPEQDALKWTIRGDMSKRPDAYRSLTPEAFERTLITKGVPQKYVNELQGDLLQLQNPKAAPAGTGSAPSWVTDLVIEHGRQAGHFASKGNPMVASGEDGRIANAAQGAALRELARQQAANPGKPIDRAAVNDAIATQYLTARVAGTGIFSDDEVPLAEYRSNPAYQGKRLDAVDKVPEAAATELRRQAAEAGITGLTDDEVKQRYQELLNKAQNEVAPARLDASLGPTPTLTATVTQKPKLEASLTQSPKRSPSHLTPPPLQAVFDAVAPLGPGAARFR